MNVSRLFKCDPARFDVDEVDSNAIYYKNINNNKFHEVKVFYDDAINYSLLDVVITLHKDCGLNKFNLSGLGRNNLRYYRAVYEFARTWIPARTDAGIYGGHSDDHGLILKSARGYAKNGELFS